MASGSTIADHPDAGASARLRLRCWGDFAVTDIDGTDLKPRGRKARALLAYLALHPGKPISRERLAGLLWGDRGEEQARASLRQAILELKPLVNGGRDALFVDRDHLTLSPAALATDLAEIRAAAAREDYSTLVAALPDPDERLFANLDHVDEDFDDWLAIERTRQRDALLTLIADASATALAHGQTRHARALHMRQQELDPASGTGAAIAAAAIRPAEPVPTSESGHRVPRHPIRRPWQGWWVAVAGAALAAILLLAVSLWQARRDGPASVAALAVLPFKDLSGRDEAHFAEGVSEEILRQLARNPRLKVIGRTSAWSFRDRPLDAPAIGRALGVDYLIEGSVRSVGRAVRVNVSLVRAGDGAQLWSQRFDGPLDQIFAIQDRIGEAVTGRLGGSGARPPPRPPIATRADAYGLFLTARGLMRTRLKTDLRVAIGLLQEAVKLDPGFALAWAHLGGAIRMQGEPLPGSTDRVDFMREAERHVRHALRLQPDLAKAHAMLGMVLSFESAEARAHLARAVEIDPNDPETLYWLSHAAASQGDFQRKMRLLRRAAEIDPLWHRVAIDAAVVALELGLREEAVARARRFPRHDPRFAFEMSYGMARAQGDFSAMASEPSAARLPSDVALYLNSYHGLALMTLGYPDQARMLLRLLPHETALVRGALPSRETLVRLHEASLLTLKEEGLFRLAMRNLLASGKGGEIAALYDGGQGDVSDLSRGTAAPALLVQIGPSIALALRLVGREPEASLLLARSETAIRRALARGDVPNWYHAAAAQTWSLQGKQDQALASLTAAVDRGWHYVSWTPQPDIADLPAFRPLRGHPRFERLRARLKAHLDRERRELGPIAA